MKDILIKSKWLYKHFSQFKLFLLFSIGLSAIQSGLNVYKAVLGKNLIDEAASGQLSSAMKLLFILAGVLIFEVVLYSLTSYITTYCSTDLTNKVQNNLFHHITYSLWIESSKYHSGNLLTRITDDVTIVTNLFVSTIPSIISFTVLLITSFVALLFYAPELAIISLLAAPIILALSRVFAGKIRRLHIEAQQTESTYRSFIQETLQNSLIVKTFCLERSTMDSLDHIQRKKLKIALSRSFISIVSNVILFIGSLFNYFLVFLWGAFKLSAGTGSFGTLTALLQLSGNIQGPMSKLASSFPQIITAFASAERLMEIEAINLEPKKSIAPNTLLNNIKHPSIEFNDICFSYTPNVPILKNISFNIPSGSTVALIGPSGEGKTTLIRLILSLVNEQQGKKFIAHENKLIGLSPDTRELISYVPQGNTLFSGSISDNLRYGNYDATDDELIEALQVSSAWEFVEKFPAKLNALIGERGTGISEGQAQRLAIARALLRKRPILILDEATSALDAETEVNILQELRTLPYKPTIIIITHRASALSICNMVLKLDKGHLHDVTNLLKSETAIEIL
ncbi:ABC transporter ATP-binding protein [Clostridium thermarum]|uniref:ABC transporter ATP-binding protein n=1 Tax=Clostridium thermarum TaxID=1716543 RepID=UPI0013D822F5|nr:ABC transporter ATP-binding protein [Clostridium thermarum]